jgi:hypothetical protein
MKTDLVRAANCHPLVPEGRDRPVNDVVIAKPTPAMIGRTQPAIVDQAPKIIGKEVAAHEGNGFECRQGVARDDELDDRGLRSRFGSR